MSIVSRVRLYGLRLFNQIDAGLILAVLLTLPIIQNFWQPGLPAGADIPIHLYRLMEFERAWVPGVIVPRWGPNLAFGYGYPLFVFAPPLPYLLGLLFHTAGLSFEATLRTLLIVTVLLYAAGMYLLVRDLLHSTAAGLVAATAYAFAPVALREALLYGGNIPQYLAIALFPWTLWAMVRAVQSPAWGWIVLAAIFYASVVLSHLFQALILTPVVAVFGLILVATPFSSLSFRTGSLRRLLVETRPLLVIPLGLLLSAFFWLPAYTERFFTRALAEVYLEKSPFFIRYPHWNELVAWIQPLDARAANPYVPLTLGVITLALAAVGLVSGLLITWQNWGVEKKGHPSADSRPVRNLGLVTIFFMASLAVTATFLSLPVSRPLWDRISFLQLAQFPWRMLGVANLGLAFLAGAAMHLPPRRFRPPVTVIALLLLLFGVAPFLYPVTSFAHYSSATIADQINYERSSQSVGATTLGEYLPRPVTRPPTTSPLVGTYQTGQIPERLDRASLPATASATLLKQNAVTHRYRLDSPTPFTLRFFQFDYPGWRATLDGETVPIRPETETGLILIEIPAGQHTLTLHFGETTVRIAALALTGLTLIGLSLAGLFHSISRQAPTPKPAQDARPHLSLDSTVVLIGISGIVLGALWLKPWLRPLFTIESPPDQVLPAQHQTEIEFERDIELIGYDLSQAVIPAGGYLQVVLYWQTDAAPIQANLQPFVHLDRLGDWTTIAGTTNYTPGDVTTESNLPTFHWDNARYIRDEHDLFLPSDIPPLAYAVRVGLIDPDQDRLIDLADGSGDTAQIAVINVTAGSQKAPRLRQQLDTTLGLGRETIQLTGFELNAVTPEQLDFRVAWQTANRLQTDYTVFAQLLDLNQNLVAGFDGLPLDGAYPTSTWLPGQTIIDPRHVPLDQVPPGKYKLIVGLYDPTTQRRLTTPGGADFVELTRVRIGKEE